MGTFIKIIFILFIIVSFGLTGRYVNNAYGFDEFNCGWFFGLAAGYITQFITELKVTIDNNK